MNFFNEIPDGYVPIEADKLPHFMTAADLMKMEFPPIRYVVPGYITEGLTLLAGRPKLGKSWFVLDMALGVSFGGITLGGVQCDKGEVLYLALEDNARRLKSRLQKIWQNETLRGVPIPDGLTFATEWPRANDGGIVRIREWLKHHSNARLVIIDVLAMFKGLAKGKDQSLYEADYHAIKELQALASERSVAIVVVHHTRKSAAEVDPFEKVSGTLGLSGAADTVLILDKDQNGATLYGRGRDIEEIETAVQFDRNSCRWTVLGQAYDVRRTDERKEILSVLLTADEPLSPRDITLATGRQQNAVHQLLFKMAKAQEVHKSGRGKYIHPNRTELIEADTQSAGKNDKKSRNWVDGEGDDDDA
jgi:hypothetical protein